MDGTTEPIIAVIGHPIAGNPTQFAVERALRSLKMDWRVLSFDVKPDDVAIALEGFSVTGIAGVMIDPSVREEASRWYAAKTDATHDTTPDLNETWDESASENDTPAQDAVLGDAESSGEDEPSGERVLIDCLFRDDEQKFVGSYEQRAWIDERISQHADGNRIWLGDSLENLPLSRNAFAEDPILSPPDLEVIENANLIVIAGDAEAAILEAEDWPPDDGSTMIIDLTRGHRDQSTMQQLGYHVVTELDRRIGTLQRCLQRWTGEHSPADVIHDAIEEYLGV